MANVRKYTARLSLKCSCGDRASGLISPVNAATKFRDLWLKLHTGEEHVVTDKSEITDQAVFLR